MRQRKSSRWGSVTPSASSSAKALGSRPISAITWRSRNEKIEPRKRTLTTYQAYGCDGHGTCLQVDHRHPRAEPLPGDRGGVDFADEGVEAARAGATVAEAAAKYRKLRNPGSYVGPWLNEETPYLVEPDGRITRAAEADFFAIGTNDLIQYSLAIDRSNENVSYLYEPLHPALLRLIKSVIDAGKRAGIPVSMCGEMASDPIYAIVLLGLGLEIFSMNPSNIPVIKNVIRSVRYRDCRRIAEIALQKKTAQEIEEFIIESVAMRFPEGLVQQNQ